MPIEFFVSTDEEVENTNDLVGFFDLAYQYDMCASGANDFATLKDISNFFLKNEDFVPNKISKKISGFYSGEKYELKIYKFDKQFTEGVAKIDRDKLDTPEAIKYWHSRGYFGMGTWNAFYGLHNLCKFGVRDNKDVFVLED